MAVVPCRSSLLSGCCRGVVGVLSGCCRGAVGVPLSFPALMSPPPKTTRYGNPKLGAKAATGPEDLRERLSKVDDQGDPCCAAEVERNWTRRFAPANNRTRVGSFPGCIPCLASMLQEDPIDHASVFARGVVQGQFSAKTAVALGHFVEHA